MTDKRALHELSAPALIDAYRRREFSPVEVIRSVLGHIERWEHHLQALYLLRPEARAATGTRQRSALAARRAAGPARRRARHHQGKHRHAAATRRRWERRPCELVPAAVRRAAGRAHDAKPARVIVAKTTMPDYGMLSSGLSSFHKLARNPWDLAKTPGGSSAGAGAAAAAGYGPLHIGTDIGGSLRLPAGWCGIFTLKPSLGRIPIDAALHGPGRRPDDAHRRRRGLVHAGAVAARCARQHEPAVPGHRLGTVR